ncbi:hypothetical protein LY78DRAFT_591972, partial [Colletotrichum sublineola]
FTALHFATELRNTNAIEILARRGVEVNAVSNNGRLALYIAVENKHLKAVDILLELGSKC